MPHLGELGAIIRGLDQALLDSVGREAAKGDRQPIAAVGLERAKEDILTLALARIVRAVVDHAVK
jgi:hypothetical protein